MPHSASAQSMPSAVACSIPNNRWGRLTMLLDPKQTALVEEVLCYMGYYRAGRVHDDLRALTECAYLFRGLKSKSRMRKCLQISSLHIKLLSCQCWGAKYKHEAGRTVHKEKQKTATDKCTTGCYFALGILMCGYERGGRNNTQPRMHTIAARVGDDRHQ